MYDKLEIFQMAGGLAAYSSSRQSVIAGNIANADTPGYRARDIAPFSETYRADNNEAPLRATRAGHIAQPNADSTFIRQIDSPGATAPNGNTVSLETEMMKAAEVRVHQDLALSVYQTSLSILRTSLGRGR